MKSLLYGLLGISLATLWLLNFSAGIIGGIWLIIDGLWIVVVLGVIFSFIMPFIYSLALIPTLIFIPLITKLAENGQRFWIAILGFCIAGYTNLITAIWVVFIFEWLLKVNNLPSIPSWLFGYSVIMGAIGYMASKEDRDSIGTTFGVLFAQITYFILTINLFFGGNSETGYGWVWLFLISWSIISISIGVSFIPKKTKNNESQDKIDLLINEASESKKYTDEIYAGVKAYTLTQKNISASKIQKQFGTDYTKACVILVQLQDDGIIERSDNHEYIVL